jgi:hypothetical protein
MTALDYLPGKYVTPTSARDYLSVLNRRLDVQAMAVAIPEAYYNGHHPLQFATSKFNEGSKRRSAHSSPRSRTIGVRSSWTRPWSAYG